MGNLACSPRGSLLNWTRPAPYSLDSLLTWLKTLRSPLCRELQGNWSAPTNNHARSWVSNTNKSVHQLPSSFSDASPVFSLGVTAKRGLRGWRQWKVTKMIDSSAFKYERKHLETSHSDRFQDTELTTKGTVGKSAQGDGRCKFVWAKFCNQNREKRECERGMERDGGHVNTTAPEDSGGWLSSSISPATTIFEISESCLGQADRSHVRTQQRSPASVYVSRLAGYFLPDTAEEAQFM